MIVARQGLGNMSVSNAFGSNVFNIFAGLGLPWLLYILFHNNGSPYDELKDGGIVLRFLQILLTLTFISLCVCCSVMILIVVLVLFFILLIFTQFVITKSMGYCFLVLYLVYISYAIATA